MRFLVLLGIFLLCINQSINQSIGKKFKPHGRYEKLAKQEYIQGINQLINQPINQPTAVLTSLTGIDRSIAVSWVTFNQSIHRSINRFTNQPIHQPIDQPINQSTNQSIFWGFQSNNYTHQSIATTKVWIDPSSTYNNQSIDQSIYRLMHQSTMQNLPPGTTVYYRVGSTNQSINQPIDQAINQLEIVNKLVNVQSTNQPINQPLGQLSQEWEFKTLPINQSINLAIYGDMGVVNARSMQSINQSIDQSITHMILHLGDYAYDLHTDNGTLGDVFMHNLQPLSARVPYMGCEGNHEGKYNASHYTNRFWAYNMLGRTSRSDTNWWFSWEYESNGAKVHFAMINTEMYYTYVDEFTPPDYSTQRAAQYQWLANDLARASQTADWIFVYGHRPMYCSDVDSLGDCTSDATLLREGWPGENNGMDAILRKYGVDIYFTAHEHSYERTYPVSFGQIDLKQENHTYINPLYTTHIITGSAGCSEELEWFDPVNFAAWSMVRSPTYGYGHLIIHNKTHLHWEQLIDEGKQESDTLWIIKDKDYRQEVEMASE